MKKKWWIQKTDDNQSIMYALMSKRSNYVCFKPLIYYNKQLDRNYYYKFFKPYTFHHRLLTMDYDCGCPKRRVHKSSCSWYDTDNIYMIETRADISISEKVAQQKIYKIYMETLNNLPDECGCGTLASISYMGHSTGCNEFLHIHERESHEVLLAILNKKKTLTFGDETNIGSERVRFDVQAGINEDTADTTQVSTIPCAKETTSELKTSSPHALSMLAENVTSNQNLPNNPPNPSSFTDTPLVNEVNHGEKSEDEEMPPLMDITDDITG